MDLRTRLALNIFRQFRKNTTKIHELNYILWECTMRCNLNCLHCGSDCLANSQVKDMPIRDFLKAIDEIKPIVNSKKTIIGFTGGEPLLRNDIETCGKELYNREFPWGIVTNGLLLNEKRLQSLLSSGMRSLTVSLDGTEENHNWLRNNTNSYKQVVNILPSLSSADNLVYDVVTCVNQKNINELHKIKDLLIEKKVKNWRLFTIFPRGRAKENELLMLTGLQLKQVMDFIVECRKEGIIKADFGCDGFLGDYEGKARDNFFFCRSGISTASILVDGSITGCLSMRDDYIQGNIYKDNFADCWNNRFEKMRNRSWTKTGKCENCKEYKWCEGEGLHLRDGKSGELLFCHYEKLMEE